MSSIKKSKKKTADEDEGFQLFAAPVKKTKKAKSVKSSDKKAQKSKVQPHKPQKESVKAVDKPLEAKKEDVSTE